MYDYWLFSDHNLFQWWFCHCSHKIKVPHPTYPSTRILVQVPNVGIHFSPKRYAKMMDLLKILNGTMETCSQPAASDFLLEHSPWSPAALATECRILVWKVYPKIYVNYACLVTVNCLLIDFLLQGIGHSVATWQPCFLVLSGSYLYVFESSNSQNYQHYLRYFIFFVLFFFLDIYFSFLL